MKTITRYIKKICHNCSGTGTDYNIRASMNSNAVCRICNGSGIEIITEIEEILDINNPTNYTNRIDTVGNPIKEL